MKYADKIILPAEMKTKSVRRLFKILQFGAKEPRILFVGGCVRNAILSEAISDIDLATTLHPEDVIRLLTEAGVKVIPTGIDHGTVTAVLDSEVFQITTLRKDVETNGRHAVVAFTDDWAEDAGRRDFTLNTLLADLKGGIYDPLGTGLRDLRQRKIRFVGEADIRIREDYLRILRFFRFHARYGKGRPDALALKACAKYAHKLKILSKERVTQEILKILSGPQAGSIIPYMNKSGVLKALADPKFEESHFKHLEKLNKSCADVIGLAILAGFSKSGTRRIENSLRLSKIQIKQLDSIITYLKTFKALSDFSLKLLLYKAGREVAELVLLSRLVIDNVPQKKAFLAIEALKTMEKPILPLRGQDLIIRGMAPGPEIKKTLEKFERLWIKNNFRMKL